MMNIELLRKRELYNLSRDQLCRLSNIKREDYDFLENGSSFKMSNEEYLKLKDILGLDNKFYLNYVSPYKDLTNLSKIRKDLKLSLDKMHKITGISKSSLYDIEQGKIKKLEPKSFDRIMIGYKIKDKENYEPFLKRSGKIKIKFINDGTFGILIKEKRNKLKMTQDTLALISSIDHTMVSKVENLSKTTMNYETALKLMEALDFSKEEIEKYTQKIRR